MARRALVGSLAVGAALVGGCGIGQPAQLPDLKGKTLAQIETTLGRIGLRFEATGLDGTDYCDDRSDCYVTATSPEAGTVVKWGGLVKVSFLTGGEQAFYTRYRKMPKVVGWSEAKMNRVFEPVSSVVEGQPKETPKVKVGQSVVIAQSPKAGTPLKVGQAIKLTVGYNTGTSSKPQLGDGRESRFCSRRWWC